MLAKHTPKCKGKMIRNELLSELMKKHQFEVMTFPIHYSDQMCVKAVSQTGDHNIVTYVALMKGVIPILTIAGHKAFVVDMPKRSQRQFPNPFYNNTETEEKHHQGRKD